MGADGIRPRTGEQPCSGGNHALEDYQLQLNLFEQQNKQRLVMARHAREGPGGPGVPGSTGQTFQGISPQGIPQMVAGGMPLPLPEGQSRGSPSATNFMLGQMNPNMAPHFYKQMGGKDGNLVAGIPDGMHPPSSVPANFSGQQQQQQGGIGHVPGWQAGPNGTLMIQQRSKCPVPQSMGTQQRAIPPPTVPTIGAPANGHTQSSSQHAEPQEAKLAKEQQPQQRLKTLRAREQERRDKLEIVQAELGEIGLPQEVKWCKDIKYVRRNEGDFAGRLVRDDKQLITIEGNDYVEMRVLLKILG
jgi:hypothetical protein